MITNARSIMLIHPPVPARSVSELVALAKARPGTFNYGSVGSGSSSHIFTEMFKARAGVNIVHVPYKGNAAILTALAGGEVQLYFPLLSSGLPLAKSGRLRALAVSSGRRSALAQDIPTFAESGFPDFETSASNGVVAPSKTPKDIVAKLNLRFNEVLRLPEVREKLASDGAEIVGGTPETYGAKISADIAKTARVIKDVGIRTD